MDKYTLVLSLIGICVVTSLGAYLLSMPIMTVLLLEAGALLTMLYAVLVSPPVDVPFEV